MTSMLDQINSVICGIPPLTSTVEITVERDERGNIKRLRKNNPHDALKASIKIEGLSERIVQRVVNNIYLSDPSYGRPSRVDTSRTMDGVMSSIISSLKKIIINYSDYEKPKLSTPYRYLDRISWRGDHKLQEVLIRLIDFVDSNKDKPDTKQKMFATIEAMRKRFPEEK